MFKTLGIRACFKDIRITFWDLNDVCTKVLFSLANLLYDRMLGACSEGQTYNASLNLTTSLINYRYLKMFNKLLGTVQYYKWLKMLFNLQNI